MLNQDHLNLCRHSICLKEKLQIGILFILSLPFKGEFTPKVWKLTPESSILINFRSSSPWDFYLEIVLEIQVINF